MLKNGKRRIFGPQQTDETEKLAPDEIDAHCAFTPDRMDEQEHSYEPEDGDTMDFTCGSDLAGEQISVLLNDYCGVVAQSSIGVLLHKNEQTDCPEQFIENKMSQTENLFKPQMVSTSAQTDPLKCLCNFELKHEPEKEVKPTRSVGVQVNRPDLTFEDIEESDEMCMFYTGLPNAKTFNLLFNEMADAELHTHRSGSGENKGHPRLLRLIDEFFLVMIRLRLGLLLQDLARRFHISKSTCSNITNQWISYMSVKLSFLTCWPTKSTIQDTMPNKFKKKYPNCRVIIDCTEIFTENPQSLANKSLMYSHYKSHMTYKAVLGISPGLITFSSDLWVGSISDKQLTMNCRILDLCEAGDAIMADKGFLISDLTTPRGISLIIPPLKYQRFSRKQVEEKPEGLQTLELM